jgi:Rod binding domain-containing protein
MMLSGVNSGSLPASAREEINAMANQPGTAAHKKLCKAAQDFEGMLISQLLGDFTSGFSSLSGDAPMAGSETLNSLAVQTLSSAMAGRGGFGIGKMLVHQLEPSLPRGK